MKNLKRIILLFALICSGTAMYAQSNVGVGTNTPSEKLDVIGNVKADTLKANVLKITPNAGSGKILKSDANGNGSWQNSPCTYSIGQNVPALGGFIFYLDASGCHGLVCAPTDQSPGIQWYDGVYTITNAVRDGRTAGIFNTERIIANQGTGAYAAQLCANYQVGGNFGGWYLPSKYELSLMYSNIGQGAAPPNTNIGGFAPNIYWSSTEDQSTHACVQNFISGGQGVSSKYFTHAVRAVRAF